MRRAQVTYRGLVQGVGFRATCVALASHWPLTGFVRNERDGSVYLEVQGTAFAVEEFLAAVASRMQSQITAADQLTLQTIANDAPFHVTY